MRGGARGAHAQRCTEVHRGAQRWRCRGAAVQRCSGAEVQRCRGAEDKGLDADDKVEDPSERSREEETGEDGGPDEDARIEAAAATRQVELLHVHGGHARSGSGAAQMAWRVRQRSGGAASMTRAEGYGRLARQLERRRARAEAHNEHGLEKHPVHGLVRDEARARRRDEGAICAGRAKEEEEGRREGPRDGIQFRPLPQAMQSPPTWGFRLRTADPDGAAPTAVALGGGGWAGGRVGGRAAPSEVRCDRTL